MPYVIKNELLLKDSDLFSCLQLGKGGWRRPLTMGNQQSETKEEFNARSGLSEPIDFKGGPMPFNLKSHHTEGPSKVYIISTLNPNPK